MTLLVVFLRDPLGVVETRSSKHWRNKKQCCNKYLFTTICIRTVYVYRLTFALNNMLTNIKTSHKQYTRVNMTGQIHKRGKNKFKNWFKRPELKN
jgi:hypothetical protein